MPLVLAEHRPVHPSQASQRRHQHSCRNSYNEHRHSTLQTGLAVNLPHLVIDSGKRVNVLQVHCYQRRSLARTLHTLSGPRNLLTIRLHTRAGDAKSRLFCM